VIFRKNSILFNSHSLSLSQTCSHTSNPTTHPCEEGEEQKKNPSNGKTLKLGFGFPKGREEEKRRKEGGDDEAAVGWARDD